MPRRSTNTTGDNEPEIVDVLAEGFQPDPPQAPEPAERPAPEHTLTPEQRRIRDLEDQLAKERGGKDPELVYEAPTAGEKVLIHFLEDGFTALGVVWYRGQELEVTVGSGAWHDTCDRTGRSWLALRSDESTQVERWGRVMFRPGPWPGKPLEAAATARWDTMRPLRDGQPLAPTVEELRRAQKAEADRGRAAPRLPVR